MRLLDLVETSRAVAATRSRKDKIDRLAACIRALSPDERASGVAFLSGELPGGRVGIGWAALREARELPAPEAATLVIADVERALDEIGRASGRGGATARKLALGSLMARAIEPERDFLIPLLGGELRQGALEGVVVEAVALAASLPAPEVRRAFMMAGALGPVAAAALDGGREALARFTLDPLHPVLPMLASPAEDLADALAQLGTAALELKLDGARVQLHRRGGEVRVFSRGLHDVTAAVPELVERAESIAGGDLILDGEAIALGPGGRPLPFQITMRRFGRKLDVDALRRELPLDVFFFDALHAGGETLIDRPARERIEALAAFVPEPLRMPRKIVTDEREAEAFFREALARGHEGIMAKSLVAPYEAGSRGAAWLKIKPAHTLDLVVLAAEWGSGRRRGWLSNLHLGARDPQTNSFVMLGKTFKGMTDEMLRWQTEKLLTLERAREAHVVWVRPELVVEVAFSDVQASSQYPGGVALRFARVKRYRPDKRADEADTIEAVRAIHLRALGHDAM